MTTIGTYTHTYKTLHINDLVTNYPGKLVVLVQTRVFRYFRICILSLRL